MTELETMQRAKMYLDKLAQGIDPITDREIPEDSTLNNVRLARCFFYVSGVLGQVIANGGVIGGSPSQPFTATRDQLARVQLSQEPIRITQLVNLINAAIGEPQMKKPNVNIITNWLLSKGFLEIQLGPDGKNRRVPTQNGIRIGMSLQVRQGPQGEYQAVMYNTQAQQFILDNLMTILTERNEAVRP